MASASRLPPCNWVHGSTEAGPSQSAGSSPDNNASASAWTPPPSSWLRLNGNYGLSTGTQFTMERIARTMREQLQGCQLTAKERDTCGHALSMALDELRE